MKLNSARSSRLKRRRSRQAHPTLHLVSLMDIFTILVFFLLVNSSTADQVSVPQNILLPPSTADKPVEDQWQVAITRTHLLLNNKPLLTLDDLNSPTEKGQGKQSALSIPKLAKALSARTRSAKTIPPKGFQLTLLCDRSTPYEIIKKVLHTANENHHQQVSFAVLQHSAGTSS